MSKFRRTRREKIRYGDPEFDSRYVEWGFHDRETQIGEARAILDLACGIGTHAIYWAGQLWRVGFKNIELRTAEGEVFHGGEEPYWLWIVARR